MLGTALGVTSVVAVHLVSERIKADLETNVPPSGYTHIVRGEQLTEDAYFDARTRWRSGAADRVEAMVPLVEGYARSNGRPHRLVGIDLLADWRPARTRPAGAFAPDVELLTSDTVLAGSAIGLTPGDVIRMNDTDVTVAGTFGGDADWFLADIATARKVLARPEPTAVWIRVRQASHPLERWFPGSTAGFDQGEEIDLGGGLRAQPLSDAEPTRRFALALLFNLGALGFLALFVAAFLIYQSSHANVARRAPATAHLGALGVTTTTLRVLFVGEGALLGLCGTALGVACGWAFATLLLQSPLAGASGVTLSGVAVAKGAASGIGIAALGALAASRRAQGSGMRYLAITGALVLLLVSLLSSTLAASFGIVLALCILQLAVVIPLAARFLRRVFERHGGRLAIRRRLALRSVAGQLAEIDIAVGALSIAVAAAIGIGTMVESFRRDFVAMLDQRLWEGMHVELDAGVSTDPPALAWLREFPNVTDVRLYARAEASVDGVVVDVTLTRADLAEARRYGHDAEFANAVLVNESGARALGVESGDTVRVTGPHGGRNATVADVYTDYGAPGPRVVGAFSQLRGVLDGVAYDRVSILTGDGDHDDLAAALEARFPNAVLRDHHEIRDRALTVFDRSFEIASYLTLIALAVAVAGLYNALSELQARRRGENRLLYTLGVGHGRIALLATEQNALLGVGAAVLAIPLGLGIAWVLCAEVNPRAFGWSISWRVEARNLVPPVALGIAAALLAGLGPTRRATRALTGAVRDELA